MTANEGKHCQLEQKEVTEQTDSLFTLTLKNTARTDAREGMTLKDGGGVGRGEGVAKTREGKRREGGDGE